MKHSRPSMHERLQNIHTCPTLPISSSSCHENSSLVAIAATGLSAVPELLEPARDNHVK